jgi:NDP-sugar pyrophosphorylase family protein
MRSKARLTITLPLELLAEIDRTIDKRTVRNRSHAIELLLRDSLRPVVSKAVLLAGGPGDDNQPPGLQPIQGQALIVKTINHLISYGIRSFIILAGRHETTIRDLVGQSEYMGAEIHYVSEQEPLGTAGALKAAAPYLSDTPFIVFHADILTDINVAEFIKFHFSQNKMASIAVKPRQAGPNYGKVMLEGNQITDFIPKGQGEGISIINAGVYLFEPEILSLVSEKTSTTLEIDVFPKLAKMGELGAFLFQGVWFDISRPQDYEAAQIRWQERGGYRYDKSQR